MGTDAGDKVLKEQLASLKRENNELNTKVKQLDAELKKGARQATTMGNEEVRFPVITVGLLFLCSL